MNIDREIELIENELREIVRKSWETTEKLKKRYDYLERELENLKYRKEQEQ